MEMQSNTSKQSSSNNGTGANTSTSTSTSTCESNFPLNNLSPEEITLAAALFAIALGQSMNEQDASLLAFFLGTVSSNLGIYLEKKRRDQEEVAAEPPFPGEI